MKKYLLPILLVAIIVVFSAIIVKSDTATYSTGGTSGNTMSTGQFTTSASSTEVIAANANRLEVELRNVGFTNAYCGNNTRNASTTSILLKGFATTTEAFSALLKDDKFNGAWHCTSATTTPTTIIYKEIY